MQAGQGTQPAQLEGFQETLLLVDINGQRLGVTAIFLQDRFGMLYASVEDLARWRFRVPSVQPVVQSGQRYVSLDAVAGLRYLVDEATQSLAMDVPAAQLTGTQVNAERSLGLPPTRSGVGGFLNYSLFGEHSRGETTTSAAFEAGASTPLGVGILNYLVTHSDASTDGVRLDAYWIYDMPERMRTLRLGDSINRVGSWGRGVRFGGVQWGRNFATQPYLVTTPLQGFSGEAVVPSTVDVFVNNALVDQQSVPPGPFSITNIPVVTGAGDVRVVVRDSFGREQVVTQPYYTEPTLLAVGLSDYTFEVGAVREDYGLKSNSYGDWLGGGFYRYGFTNRLTGEVRAEATDGLFNLGGAAVYQVGNFGVVSVVGAGGHNSAGTGYLWGGGFSRQGRGLNFGARSIWTSPDFRQVGQLPGHLPEARLSVASASYNFGTGGSFGLAYAQQDYRQQQDTQVVSAVYNLTVPHLGFLGLSASRTISSTDSTALLATFTAPLGPSTNVSLSARQTRDDEGLRSHEISATVQRSMPPGDGWGYQLRASDTGPDQATVSAQNRFGTVSADVASADGETGYRINIMGGLGMVENRWFLSRQITDSFALVRVPGYGGVRVYQDNQEIGRTDASGEVILPRVRPYQINPVEIDERDFPLDVEIGRYSIDVVPYYRSGVLVEFLVRRAYGALVTVVLESGSPAPVGAVLRVGESGEAFPVAQDGEAYLTGLGGSNRVRLEWRGQSCEFDVPYPPTLDPQPRLGPFVCRGVRP
jgi:outer membrane usher protein